STSKYHQTARGGYGMKRETVFVGLLVFLSIPSCLRAQTASIGGTVIDPFGAPVRVTKVTAAEVSTGASRSAETDESGVYRFTNLTPGFFAILFTPPNSGLFLYSKIPPPGDKVLTRDVKFSPGQKEKITPETAESVPPIDLNAAQIGNLGDSGQ